MVLLSLLPRKGGNTGSRYFPFSGHLGLTPVSVSGVVRTRILDDDKKSPPTRRITISLTCYEARTTKVTTTTTNVLVNLEHTLWQCDNGQDYAPIGNLDLPFKLVLPVDNPGLSTCYLQDYKVYWRVEATIHHIPLAGVGSRQLKAFDLPLIRTHPPSNPSELPTCSSSTLPSLAYTLLTPSHALGPTDQIPISLRLRPACKDASVSRISINIQRQVDLKDPKLASPFYPANPEILPTPPPTASSQGSPSGHAPSKGKGKEINLDLFASSMLKATKRTSAVFFGTSSSDSPSADPTSESVTSIFAFDAPSTMSNQKRAPSPFSKRPSSPPSSSKLLSQNFATVTLEKGSIFTEKTEDGNIQYGADILTSLPLPKAGHWGLGESMNTSLVGIKFFVSIKVHLSSGSHDSVLLPPQLIRIVPLNQEKRSEIGVKIAASQKSKALTAVSSSRSKPSPSSKTPARAARTSDPSATLLVQPSSHSPESPFPSPPPSPYNDDIPLPLGSSDSSSSSSDLEDNQKTPRQSPVPSGSQSTPNGKSLRREDRDLRGAQRRSSRDSSRRRRGLSLDMDVDAPGLYLSFSTESEATLVPSPFDDAHPAIPIASPGPSEESSDFTSPFAYSVHHSPSDDVEMVPTVITTYTPQHSSPPIDEDDDYYPMLGGDLSFYHPRSTSRQPSALKATKTKASKSKNPSSPKPSAMSLSLSSKKLGLPTPANLRASPNTRTSATRALGVGLVVAATRTMGLKSPTSSAFRTSSNDKEYPRPKTSGGMPTGTTGAFGSPVNMMPRAGSVGAVPIPHADNDDRKNFLVGPSTSPTTGFVGGYGRGGAGSLHGGSGGRRSGSGSFPKIGNLSTIFSDDGMSVMSLPRSPSSMSNPIIEESTLQREWDDELEKIVSSSKRKTTGAGSSKSRLG